MAKSKTSDKSDSDEKILIDIEKLSAKAEASDELRLIYDEKFGSLKEQILLREKEIEKLDKSFTHFKNDSLSHFKFLKELGKDVHSHEKQIEKLRNIKWIISLLFVMNTSPLEVIGYNLYFNWVFITWNYPI